MAAAHHIYNTNLSHSKISHLVPPEELLQRQQRTNFAFLKFKLKFKLNAKHVDGTSIESNVM